MILYVCHNSYVLLRARLQDTSIRAMGCLIFHSLDVAVEIKSASVKLWGCNPTGTHKNEHDQFDFKLLVQNAILLSSNVLSGWVGKFWGTFLETCCFFADPCNGQYMNMYENTVTSEVGFRVNLMSWRHWYCRFATPSSRWCSAKMCFRRILDS